MPQEYILESLKWCGFEADESPVHGGEYIHTSSLKEKTDMLDYAMKLINSDNAYYAFDSSEELTQMRDNAKKQECQTGNTIVRQEHQCQIH